MQNHFVRMGWVVSSLIILAIASETGAFAEEGGRSMGRPGRGMMGGMRPGGDGSMPGMGMMSSCREDVQKLCAQKKGAEIRACMDEQEKAGKLSGECNEFRKLQKERQELFKTEREAVLAACKKEVAQFCKEDKIPFRCLQRKSRDSSSGISEGCSTRMKESREKMKAMREAMMAKRKGAKESGEASKAAKKKK